MLCSVFLQGCLNATSSEKLFSVSSKSGSSCILMSWYSPPGHPVLCDQPNIVSQYAPHLQPFIPLFHYFLYSQLVYKIHKGILSFGCCSTLHFQGPEKALRTTERTQNGLLWWTGYGTEHRQASCLFNPLIAPWSAHCTHTGMGWQGWSVWFDPTGDRLSPFYQSPPFVKTNF